MTAGRRFLPYALLVLAFGALVPAQASDLVAQTLETHDYPLARQVVVEAIQDEGLVLSGVSDFGDMLRRTDADLGHGAGQRYRHAEVFAFCSVTVAATLVRESADHIAYCPLTLALYQEKPGSPVRLTYRKPASAGPGGDAGRALLARIANRISDLLPLAIPAR